MDRSKFLKALGLGTVATVIPVQPGIKVSIQEYERLRKMNRKGVKLTEEHRRILSVANTGKKLSEETKEKIRQANLGKKVSEETRRKLSDFNKGKKLSQETKAKIGLKSSQKRLSEETKARIRNTNIEKKGRAILQYDLNNNLVKEWRSITEAAELLDTSWINLWGALRDKQKTAKGFIWKYKVVE